MSPPEPTSPSPPSPDYRTKAQSDEKEHFLILPQLQAKRADFLSVMLTGTLPQRHSFATPHQELPEEPGPRDDDVTKSESNSEASQKSTERSQDAAPSTLMAEDQKVTKEHASAADADPDMEDASKTLVLFSPGDTRKSPSCGDPMLEAELATPSALTSRNEHFLSVEVNPPEALEPGRLSPALRSDLRPAPPIAPASPPFTKVERTFIHIAETSHLNVMSSNGRPPKDTEQEVFVMKDSASELEHNEGAKEVLFEPESNQSVTKQPMTDACPHPAEDQVHEGPGQEEPSSSAAHRSKGRSRIPVLVSEEESASEKLSSTVAKDRLHHRVRQLDLARLLVQKQQSRWMRSRMLSGTSSSLSSGDDDRPRVSETLSTTGSEEDTHTSETSGRSCRLREREDKDSKENKSKIPRPVKAVRRASRGGSAPPAAASPLSIPETPPTKAASAVTNGNPKMGLSTLSSQRRPKAATARPTSSSTLSPAPCGGSPRMPLRALFGTRRSLSSAHSRTDSPSPQRTCPSRQPLSVRAPTVPMLPPRTKTNMRRSASQDASAPSTAAMAPPARTRTKPVGATRGDAKAREKVTATR